MNKPYVISYDLGTSGVKVALVDTEGEVLGTATCEYPLYVEHENWAEQDPELYWAGVCQGTKSVLAQCRADARDAIGMAFGTQWKGIIPVDKNGTVLHNSIIWLDGRAADQARRLNEHFGQELFLASDYWPKLMWFRENCPALYEAADTIFEANSFLKWKVTGEKAVDISNSFIRSADPETQHIYDEILTFADIDKEKFPPVVPISSRVGGVTEQAARELGLVPGIPVFAGCGDIPANTIGSGSARPGGAHIYFGTSGWVAYYMPHRFNGLYLSPFDEEHDVRLNGLNAIGLSLNWAVQRFYPEEFSTLGGSVFDLVNHEIEAVPAGCEGLLAAPWFYGEPLPIGADGRGSFFNLGAQHDRRYLTRAVMEGICLTLKLSNDNFQQVYGITPPREYSVIGGGSLSPVWMQMLADIFDATIVVPRATKHIGAVGTAYCALVGLGLRKDFAEVADKLVMEHRYEPKEENVAVYREVCQRFLQLFHTIRPLMGKK